jgi:hypothetical protein
MGPIDVRELIASLPNAGVHTMETPSWQELLQQQQALPATPDASWLPVDSYVHSTMVDDWRRVIFGDIVGTEHDPADPAYLDFVRNATVTGIGTDELHFQLDPGPFADAKDQLAGYIESVWSSPTLRAKIDWVDSTTHPDAYRFALGTGAVGRSYVNREALVVMLYADVSTKAIAHEFGHVLGFADRYLESYDETTCRYALKMDDGDLMSVPGPGVVTDAEWQVLRTQYGY